MPCSVSVWSHPQVRTPSAMGVASDDNLRGFDCARGAVHAGRFSTAARRAICAAPQAPFTPLHELEIANTFALLAGRALITGAAHDAVRGQLREDVEGQRLLPTQVDWDDAFTKAAEFSATYTTQLGTRSLALLHVAAAHLLETRLFGSAADRQLAVGQRRC